MLQFAFYFHLLGNTATCFCTDIWCFYCDCKVSAHCTFTENSFLTCKNFFQFLRDDFVWSRIQISWNFFSTFFQKIWRCMMKSCSASFHFFVICFSIRILIVVCLNTKKPYKLCKQHVESNIFFFQALLKNYLELL